MSSIALTSCDTVGVETAHLASSRLPASMEEIEIPSHGARLNGFVYLAAGAAPHPLVILLHGTPGNERNLDLAQAVRRAGYDVLYFDYRGDFGSGGGFSYAHGIEDTATVLQWARAPGNVARYRIDPSRIAVFGHSDGGFFALMSLQDEPSNVCVATLAASNVGWMGSRYADHADERAEALRYFGSQVDPAGGPLHANPEDVVEEVAAHSTAWNYLLQAGALARRAVLLVAVTHDTPDEGIEMNSELAEAIRRAGGMHVRLVSFDDDHPVSNHRVELADIVTKWLRTDCARTQGAGRSAS